MRVISEDAKSFIVSQRKRMAAMPAPEYVERVQRQPEPEHPRLLPPRDPWINRVLVRIVAALTVVTLTQLVLKVITWPLLLAAKGLGTRFKPGPVRVWLGGRVSEEEYAARNYRCGECATAFSRVANGGRILSGPFCGSCGCGEWFGSTLKRKNRYVKWYCPRKLHKDTVYPDVEFMGSIPDDQRSYVQLQLPNTSGQKGGCGQRG